MKLFVLSISHENAPLNIRERLSLTKRRQREILDFAHETAQELLILSTCGRFELYVFAESADGIKRLAEEIGGADCAAYMKIYEDSECVRHLMLTAAGLRSAILGEDQILGQVKDAYEAAMEHKATGKYLNTLFRLAVTGAKKVKTDTLLSKTPVSAATIAVRLCRDHLGTLKNKNVLIIGASGKTGGAVLKNMLSLEGVKLHATRRKKGGALPEIDGAELIEYEKRYELLDECDAVISATLSPHLTLTADGIRKAIKTKKRRIFIDLAVPRDIEPAADELTAFRNIDDISEISENNGRIKLDEVRKAEKILKEYEDRFEHWRRVSEGLE